MRERFFEQGERVNKKVEAINRELSDAGIKDPSEWRKALDLETPLDEAEEKFASLSIGEKKHEQIDLKNLDRIFTYLEGGLRIPDRSKIERFGTLTDGMERLKSLQSMSVAEAAEAVRDFGLTPGAYSHLARRLEFYQKYISGEATKKVNTQEYDEKTRQWVDVVKEEVIDASNASTETIKLGVIRDIYYAAMQGTPEMGAVKIATKRINAEVERNKQKQGASSRSSQNPVKSAVEFHGYYSGVFEGSLGLYPELSQLYKDCKEAVSRRSANVNLDEKELEHKAVLLTARRLEGAYNYNGTLNTSGSPYNAPFKESIIVGQLGHRVMRQMKGMRGRIQETNFRNVERFIGKSGDNRYQGEKKRLDKDVKELEDFVQDNNNYDASSLSIKEQGGTERQVKGKEAAELMTRQKNYEATQRAKVWFDRESEKINHWLEKSKTKIAGYDIPEEERNSIYSSVQERYNKKVIDLQQEYQGEVARLENRTPEVLLGAFKERKEIVDRRFEKRKSLAQKALDLHFRFNHEGRDYNSKPFDQIDWVNNAPFGVIKRTHRLLSQGVDDQTVMMLALAEVNGDKDDQTPGKFIANILKSGNPGKVIQNFEKFSGITEDQHLNILLSIINSGGGREAVESLDKFAGVTPNDHLQIVQALNASNTGETVITNFERFNGVRSEDKRDVLFGAIKGGGGYQFAQNFEKFSDVFSEKDHPEVVHELSKAGAGGTVIDNFQKFSGIPAEEHRGIVLEAIKGGGSYQVIQNLEKFSGITEKDHRDIVLEIIKSGGGGYYLKNALDKFKGLEEGLRQVIKAGKYESLPHVLEAGFTIEEITRFPFLISPLVTKK